MIFQKTTLNLPRFINQKITFNMKKLLMAAFFTAVTMGAFAQTATPANADKKQDMKDVRHDIRDVNKDKKLRNADLKAGDKVAARAETKDINADKKDIKGDAKDLRHDGVKHPIKRAHRQIRRHRG